MTKEVEKSKGGRKGGTMYPKVDLEKAIQYAKKLVSKTHTGSQPKNIILPGVFDSATWYGEVRLSGTKQFGLVDGNPKGYSASELAKKINSATPDELPKLLAEACLKPKVFKTIYDTFVNDTVSDAKIKQQFLNHEVHPDSCDECVTLFKNSLAYSGLAKLVDNDKLQVLSAPIATSKVVTTDSAKNGDEIKNEDDTDGEVDNDEANSSDNGGEQEKPSRTRNQNKSNVNVNIDVDPSMDPEKLEKLLKLLKNYGAL